MVKNKRTKIVKAKESAPDVPGDTCPTIDYVQEMIGQLVDRADGDLWCNTQLEMVNTALEYVRSSNQELRDSSKYWYNQYKKVA
tara:strand:+ start:124 stop:375 length:252 start_codon:yes stop_codon:yes gene_type:complete